MWVDDHAGVLYMGQDQVLHEFTSDNRLHIEYGAGWDEYLQDREWKDIVKMAEEKLSHGQGAKGKGKGKEKGK